MTSALTTGGSGRLTKAFLINTATGESFPVMYNPEELTLEQGNTFAEVAVPGLNSAPSQYIRGKARSVSMELFFDTYETRTDVRAFTGQIVALLDKDPRTGAPPILLFSMGRFQFRCLLVDAGQRFTMFLPDGTPVRSRVTVRLAEYVDVRLDVKSGFFAGSATVSGLVNPAGAGTGRELARRQCRHRRAHHGDRRRRRHLVRPVRQVPGRPGPLAGNRRPERHREPAGAGTRQPAVDPERGAGAMTSTLAPRFDVRISGLTLAADLTDQLLSLTVETDLDLAGTFSMVLRNADNKLLDSALLDLGKTVEIRLGYGNDLVPVFLGETASVEPNFPPDGLPTIRVSGYDKSYRMRQGRPEPTDYEFLNDSLIAARLAVENGLVPLVDPTPGLPEKRTQTASDMAFLKSLAEKYFFDVYVEWDRLHFEFPRPQTAAHVLTWGQNLSSFNPRITSAGLAGLQVVRGYNQELAQAVYAAAVAFDFDVDNLVERLGSAGLDLLQSLAHKGIRRESPENPLEAAVLARSILADLLEGMYEATGSCIGIPDLRAGSYLQIAGVGRRFSGTHRLRSVRHRLDSGGFTTEFTIAPRNRSTMTGLLRTKLTEEPPPNRAPAFYGVVVGRVEANNELLAVPPKVPLGRVQVSFPGLGDSFTSGWAPCVRPMAGDGAGFYALPERGEQVLVAFENGDLEKPFVLGSLWSIQQGPPVTNVDGLNRTRVIKSRSGHTITFDDTLKLGKLVLEDERGSTITLNSADGSLTISALGELKLQATAGISLTAGPGGAGAITMSAAQVNIV